MLSTYQEDQSDIGSPSSEWQQISVSEDSLLLSTQISRIAGFSRQCTLHGAVQFSVGQQNYLPRQVPTALLLGSGVLLAIPGLIAQLYYRFAQLPTPGLPLIAPMSETKVLSAVFKCLCLST